MNQIAGRHNRRQPRHHERDASSTHDMVETEHAGNQTTASAGAMAKK